MVTIFAVVAVPIFFFMLTWVIVTVYRICFPEEPLSFEQDPLLVRHQAHAGAGVLVGARDIHQDQQRRPYKAAAYTYGNSDGLPEVWVADLWQRRN